MWLSISCVSVFTTRLSVSSAALLTGFYTLTSTGTRFYKLTNVLSLWYPPDTPLLWLTHRWISRLIRTAAPMVHFMNPTPSDFKGMTLIFSTSGYSCGQKLSDSCFHMVFYVSSLVHSGTLIHLIFVWPMYPNQGGCTCLSEIKNTEEPDQQHLHHQGHGVELPAHLPVVPKHRKSKTDTMTKSRKPQLEFNPIY